MLFSELLTSVYLQFPGEDRVVVPPSMLPEVRKLHDDVVSFPKAMEKVAIRYHHCLFMSNYL